ncbi:MAG: hypothetical protein A2Y34_16780, partial [Spirochaetes bacterium GWC1_27_15]
IVHTVTYVSVEATVYFGTYKSSRKSLNMQKNNNVSYICDQYNDINNLLGIKAIQMEGVASLVTNKEELDRVSMKLIEKYPVLKNLPTNPNMIFFKIEPAKARYLDYSKGFGHTDIIDYR